MIVSYTQNRKLTVVYSVLIHALLLPHVKTFLTKILSEPKVSTLLYILYLLLDIVVFTKTWFA